METEGENQKENRSLREILELETQAGSDNKVTTIAGILRKKFIIVLKEILESNTRDDNDTEVTSLYELLQQKLIAALSASLASNDHAICKTLVKAELVEGTIGADGLLVDFDIEKAQAFVRNFITRFFDVPDDIDE